MELPFSQPHFCTVLLLVMSTLLLEKAAAVPECLVEKDGCWNPLVETFNSAIQRAQIVSNLNDQLFVEFYSNKFSSEQFKTLNFQLLKRDAAVLRAESTCHSVLTNPPNWGTEHTNIVVEEYLEIVINYVGSWISPLYHLVIELSAMQGVPETLLSKAKEIEQNNRQILDDIRWILTKVYPSAEMKEEFPSWEYYSLLKSSKKYHKFLAIFNILNCLGHDAKYTIFHLRILKCYITENDC